MWEHVVCYGLFAGVHLCTDSTSPQEANTSINSFLQALVLLGLPATSLKLLYILLLYELFVKMFESEKSNLHRPH